MATLLSVLAGCACCIAAFILYDAGPAVFAVLAVAAVVVFFLGLAIGHFIGAPLRALHLKTVATIQGNPDIDYEPTGELHEADVLSADFKEVCEAARVRRNDLSIKQQRQTAFIGDVAHELRTPLTAIRGNAEILLDPDLPPELHDKFCHTIVNEAERLTRLSNDLLTLQHIEEDTMPLELARVNLKDIAQNALDALETTLREREANARIVGEAPDVLGNADRLKQVVMNLVDNASRFIDPGGHIEVELSGYDGKSLMAVKDDGPGLGDVDPRLLFDRFYRADSSRTRGTGGTGLGLAIVKSVAEAHDGTVIAFNRPEGGACFLVALPALPPLEE